MLVLHFLSQLVWLLLPCLGLASPKHSERPQGGLSPRAGSQQQAHANLFQPGIITLPSEPAHNSSVNGTFGLGRSPYPSDVDPFGPNDDEPYSFDQKLDIWGDNVYIEVAGELEKNLDCTVIIYAHVLFTYKISTNHGNLKDGVGGHINLKVLNGVWRLHALLSPDRQRVMVIFEAKGDVYIFRKGRKYFNIRKQLFSLPFASVNEW